MTPTGPKDIDALDLAQRLIGALLLVDGVGGTIVETEAYLRDDPASHSFRGMTPANAAMFGPAWQSYVYRSYGLHWCFNIVAAHQGAVLIRALVPGFGLDDMIARRGRSEDLCSGPGRLAQALGLSAAHNGMSLFQPPFTLALPETAPMIIRGPRIGISKAKDQPWRFGLAGSPHVSRPFARSEASPNEQRFD